MLCHSERSRTTSNYFRYNRLTLLCHYGLVALIAHLLGAILFAAEETHSLFDRIHTAVADMDERLLASYLHDLGTLGSVYSKSDNLEGKAAVDTEIERAKSSGIIAPKFTLTDPGWPAGLKSLRDDYVRREREETIRVIHPLLDKAKQEIAFRRQNDDPATAAIMEKEIEAVRQTFGIRSLPVDVHSLLSHPAPDYPVEARKKHLTGKGIYLLDVDTTTGSVTTVTVVQSAGALILDNAAIRALRRWKFRSHSPVEVEVPITFSMSEKAKH